ncbi:MAG: hypothetical protein PHP62_06065 [Candidatus Moranbacteria bacterium]|nr:hypothetical protein [Candidatus Moranbacteria bacterium]
MNIIPFDFDTVLFIHTNVGVIFVAVLLLMMATGLVLYFVPIILKKKNKQTEDSSKT